MKPQNEKTNNLIAEFMGYVNTTPTDPDFNIYENSDGKTIESMSMKYHESWDWLMPVVERIEGMPMKQTYSDKSKPSISVTDLNNVYVRRHPIIGEELYFCSIFVNEDRKMYAESKVSKLEATYKAVKKFITWHNENKD